MAPVDVRKGMPSVELSREEFEKRYRSRFADPAFEALQRELDAITGAAWDAYSNYRKAPLTRKAGPGFADPDYDLSVDWLAAREAILAAQRRHDDASETPRILLINGSSRSDQTCPGEMSKTWRLVKIAEPVFREMGFAVDILDLSRLTSEFGKQIHPCKSCVSTSMALCHWPCSCYPNYALGQTDDWMNEIYPLWVAAHGIMIVTPVNWYHAPTGLKAMDRPPGLRRWRQSRSILDPRQEAGGSQGAGIEGLALSAASQWPAFCGGGPRRCGGCRDVAAFAVGLADRYVAGPGQPHRRGGRVHRLHGALRDVARRARQRRGFSAADAQRGAALGNAVNLSRAGKYQRPDEDIEDPNPK
jgi:NADPH-dependent FMN reductase